MIRKLASINYCLENLGTSLLTRGRKKILHSERIEKLLAMFGQ